MENEIRIKVLNNGFFVVIVDDRSTEELGWEEMMGVIAQVTMPDARHCLGLLRTEEEHKTLKEFVDYVTSDGISEVELEEEKEIPDNDNGKKEVFFDPRAMFKEIK